MADLVKMWKANNGKYFETLKEAEQEDRAAHMEEVFNSMPEGAESWAFASIARYLAEQGYKITNIHPDSA